MRQPIPDTPPWLWPLVPPDEAQADRLIPGRAERRKANPTGRDADPRRTIPLQSSRWQKLRRWVLEREPLCRDCDAFGVATPATDVDHNDGDPGNNDPDNLVPRCHECHSRKTMRERHGKPGVIGCDANGWPLDPRHPWNEKSPEG